MINTLATTSSTGPATPAPPPGKLDVASRVADASDIASLAADTTPAKPLPQPEARLMIEERKDAPGFVYKLVDSVTGVTLAEIPRESDSSASVSDAYSTGKVLSTTA